MGPEEERSGHRGRGVTDRYPSADDRRCHAQARELRGRLGARSVFTSRVADRPWTTRGSREASCRCRMRIRSTRGSRSLRRSPKARRFGLEREARTPPPTRRGSRAQARWPCSLRHAAPLAPLRAANPDGSCRGDFV
jgi:hypothetical protein